MQTDFDTVIIGAGVVGLSIARSLAYTGREVIILEANSKIGQGISSRNSEVIHAGIYYPYESHKQKLCLEGRNLLIDYCNSRKVDYKILGKLIVANTNEEIKNLSLIFKNGIKNGVSDLSIVEEVEIQEMEPGLQAKKAILSPSTGIIDSHGFMLSMLGDIESSKGLLSCNSKVSSIKKLNGGFEITVQSEDKDKITCRELVNSGGLDAQKISMLMSDLESQSIPKSMYCKGTYYSFSKKAPFKRLIYPVPSNGGLGIHLTLDLAGRAKFGPDAEWLKSPNYRVSSGKKNRFVAEIKKYFPNLNEDDLYPDYAGIRPKIAGANKPSADFNIQFSDFHAIPGYVALYGIESPGLTASWAIGKFVEQNIH